MKMEKFDTVEAYLASVPEDTRKTLERLRKTIKNLVPEAIESMSYGMPGYKLKGKPLVYFAGWKSHIGFYPTPSGIEAYDKKLKQYRTGKGTVKFPLKKPLPWDLIERIIRFRKKEVLEL